MISHCCLIAASDTIWQGSAFGVSDVPLTHQLCEVKLKLSHTDCTLKGDSEDIVKHHSASIHQIYGLARRNISDLLSLKDFQHFLI